MKALFFGDGYAKGDDRPLQHFSPSNGFVTFTSSLFFLSLSSLYFISFYLLLSLHHTDPIDHILFLLFFVNHFYDTGLVMTFLFFFTFFVMFRRFNISSLFLLLLEPIISHTATLNKNSQKTLRQLSNDSCFVTLSTAGWLICSATCNFHFPASANDHALRFRWDLNASESFSK